MVHGLQAAINSMAMTYHALRRICFVLMAVVILMDTKSSWSAAAGMEPVAAGGRGRGFRHQHASGILGEHKAGEHAGAVHQECGEFLVQVRVQQPVKTALGEDARRGDGRAHHLQREGQRRPLEVGAGDDLVIVGEKEGIVAGAVQLDLELGARPFERVLGGAYHLGGGPQGIRVLDLFLPILPGTSISEPSVKRRIFSAHAHRARVTAYAVKPLVEA